MDSVLLCCMRIIFRTDEGTAHTLELSKLAEKDPEFYKYLQENDRELLEFDPNQIDEDEEDESDEQNQDVDMDEEKLPVLTSNILRAWQRALLEVGIILVTSDFE